MRTLLATALLTLTPGCAPEPADAPGAGTSDSTGGTASGPGGGGDTTEDPYVPTSEEGHRIAGAVTWTLNFDADAESVGYQDCEYTRSYSGAEVRDQPYLCADCTLMFAGTAVMTDGHGDCYSQISGSEAEGHEYWGFGDGEAEEVGFYRSSLENYPLGALGDVTGFALDAEVPLTWYAPDNALDTGTFEITALGGATVSLDPDYAPADAAATRSGDYGCGWPVDNPGSLSSSGVAADDQVVPAGLFEDACGEQVSLWDFHGRYVILDAAQPDCGPCRDMSEAAAAGLEAMRAEGIDVVSITLLGASLNAVTEEPSDSTFASWLDAYDDGEPILKDRGYGYAVLAPYHGAASYPSWAILRPDMTLLYAALGYGNGTWDDIADIIRADMGG